ncbi:Terminal beta-(1-_2)-arabinofuranosyltransferase [Nocardia cerradoensis]|uniref:Terminal beta-(1->2)-arabinofuranosyltransferase n=2 Tax=Nocardia cerradoensis TaxID=85688 RepID=A0A231HCL1_9NOCA|nr:Terminal beta-(1->2)-arabinofuranosyltransferase [Nocardia cerradoensis]
MSLSISPDEMLVAGDEHGEGADAESSDRALQRDGDAARRFSVLSRTVFVGGVLVTVALFGIGAWQRRWIADDGLIVLRTVRNLLAGNGPVFNAGERVETNTSAAWTYVIWFFGWVSDARLEYVSLFVALTLSLLAVVFAMVGSARLWRPFTATAPTLLLPAGALVYIAVPPARDYATSGLENCLVIFWLGVLWWLLLRWSQDEKPGLAQLLVAGFWAGLCWVVRPEMTVIGGLALLMLFCAPVPRARLRPVLIRALLVAVGGAVPVGYQIWRMGYYGLPYPNTAVAKEAGGAKWGQGLKYLWDLIGPYYLWIPLLILVVVTAVLLRGRRRTTGATVVAAEAGRWVRLRRWLRSPAAVVTLMVGGGLLLVLFNMRVGGDFMHGRMLLPQLFCLLLPVSVLPVRLPVGDRSAWLRWSFALPLIAWLGTAGWALFAANTTADTSGGQISASGIVDERIYYVLNSGHDHPVLAEDYLDYPRMRAMLQDIAATPDGGLLINSPSFMMWYVAPPPLPIPPGGYGHTVYFLNLGMTSMNVPLSVRVIDQEGLAYPLAAHTDRLADGRIGHDKNLYPDWVIVDTGMVDQHPWMPWFLDEKWVRQARTALSCPATQDLLASYRAPLTWDRFKHNVIQSLHFAKYRIDRVPKYEIQRCRLVDPTTPPPVPN